MAGSKCGGRQPRTSNIEQQDRQRILLRRNSRLASSSCPPPAHSRPGLLNLEPTHSANSGSLPQTGDGDNRGREREGRRADNDWEGGERWRRPDTRIRWSADHGAEGHPPPALRSTRGPRRPQGARLPLRRSPSASGGFGPAGIGRLVTGEVHGAAAAVCALLGSRRQRRQLPPARGGAEFRRRSLEHPADFRGGPFPDAVDGGEIVGRSGHD